MKNSTEMSLSGNLVPKIIHRACCEWFHAETIFFLPNYTKDIGLNVDTALEAELLSSLPLIYCYS